MAFVSSSTIGASTALPTFVGFSTNRSGSGGKGRTKLFNADLVTQDLLNQFSTWFGTRIMRPNYGCKIWQYLMEPDNISLEQDIYDDANRILQSDSRVEIINLFITAIDHGYRVDSNLFYTPLKVYQDFTTSFEQRQVSGSSGLGF